MIAQDAKHHRDDDVVGARGNSKAIFKGLGIGDDDEARMWTELASRAWTLLSRAYAEHQRCGVFVFGGEEKVEESYPSLVAAVRGPTRRAPPPQTTSVAAAPGSSNIEPGGTD